MSTLSNYAASVPPAESRRSGARRHQSTSWLMLVAPLRWLERRWQRAALREIVDDPRTLNDVGLTREQVLCEVNKPFWRHTGCDRVKGIDANASEHGRSADPDPIKKDQSCVPTPFSS